MKMIELKHSGEISPEAKEKLNKRIFNRNKRLKEMKEAYLNGEYDEMFNKIPSQQTGRRQLPFKEWGWVRLPAGVLEVDVFINLASRKNRN